MSSITTLAAAAVPAKVSAGTGAAIGGTLFVTLVLGAIIVYCVKHKGWDTPQIVIGYLFCLTVSGVSWGASLNGSISGGLSSLYGGAINFLSNLG
jgi:hypothetical protein